VLSSRAGLGWGLLGVLAFSFTVPFTRVADSAFSPLFVGAGRAVVAAALAAAALAATGQRRPRPLQLARLLVVAGGVVLGFPLLTAFALTTAPASHGAVVTALLPAATAVAAVLRARRASDGANPGWRERPSPSFWVSAALGAVAALVFAAVSGGGLGHLDRSDLLLFAAVVAAALGYAEGGLLARDLGSWQTVSWALVLASPVMVALTALAAPRQSTAAAPGQWLAFAYLSCVSMFLGFFAWYRGLAIGPIARVSQVQLAQPVLTIAWAGLFLGEAVTRATVLGGLAVVLCAGVAVQGRAGGGR
jgi:drug/metabolite transporter (DMT)-like permease